MNGDGWKWLEMARNERAKRDLKVLEGARNIWKWLEKAGNSDGNCNNNDNDNDDYDDDDEESNKMALWQFLLSLVYIITL